MSDAEMSPGIAHTPDSDSFAVRVLPTHLQSLSIVCYSAAILYQRMIRFGTYLFGSRIEVGVMAHPAA